MKNKLILVLSGEIATGKSTLAKRLETNFGFRVLSTRNALEKMTLEKYGKKRLDENRSLLQKYGETMDKETKGKWVSTYFQEEIRKSNFVIIESARIQPQVDELRRAFGLDVIHVHLMADPDSLKSRFLHREKERKPHFSEEQLEKNYDTYKRDKTEKQVNDLKDKADLIVSTEKMVEKDVFIRVAGFLKLLGTINKPLVDVIVGAQYGSEGKGQIVGHLSPEYDCLLRVGGPNAGHKVYHEIDGNPCPDVFHILPSGTRRNQKAQLIIGPGAVINLETIIDEIRKFGIDSPSRLIIDPHATVISKSDINKEQNNKIGGTGRGVGYATANNIINRLKGDTKFKAENTPKLKQYIKSSHEVLEHLFRADKKILLEGTQGTFLSLHHGDYPFVTSRDTTVAGCLSEAGIGINRVRKVVLVARTYPIRVQNPKDGSSGDFVNRELTWDTISERSGIDKKELYDHEKTSTTHKQRRVAEFSWYELRKACELNSPTDIALSFTDYLNISNKSARRYDQLSSEATKFIEEVERTSGIPVSLISTRFAYRSIIDRRNWI